MPVYVSNTSPHLGVGNGKKDGEVLRFENGRFETEDESEIKAIESNPYFHNGQIRKLKKNEEFTPPSKVVADFLGVTTSTNAGIPTGEPIPAETKPSFVEEKLKVGRGRPKKG